MPFGHEARLYRLGCIITVGFEKFTRRAPLATSSRSKLKISVNMICIFCIWDFGCAGLHILTTCTVPKFQS